MFALSVCRAWRALNAMGCSVLRGRRVSTTQAARFRQGGKGLFGWLLEQDLSELHDLLAFCIAVSINTVSDRENAPSEDVAALMIALNLDMADWWKPTPENYLLHVPKDQILSVVAEAVSADKADLMRGLKKQELVRRRMKNSQACAGCLKCLKAATWQEEQ